MSSGRPLELKPYKFLCEFVRRFAEVKAENMFTDKEGVQQILVNTTREELRKRGISEFDCSVSESSDTEPQGKVER